MNRKSFIAKQKMRQVGNTKNRAEQMLIKEVLEFHLPGFALVKTEEHITYPTEYQTVKDAWIDIFVVLAQNTNQARGDEYFIRVMGESHDTNRQESKDDLQKGYLLLLQQVRPLKDVIDLWYYKMPITFKRRVRKLKESELIQAYSEIKRELGVLPLPDKPYLHWLHNTTHIKK